MGLAGISRDKSPPQEPTRNEGRMMPPPEKPRASQSKRKSLDSARGTKRGPSVEEGSPQQRGHQSNLINGSTTRSAKTSAGHHKRSKTVGSVSDMSKPRHGSSSNSESLSRSPSPALRNNLSPTKARQPIPNVGMDTTHTSYFRLKAMGIDPVTMSPSKMPANKVRRKRARHEENEVASTKTPRLTPPEKEPSSSTDSRPSLTNVNGQSRSESQTRRSHTSSVNDEDEQLFAQMRSVREAMSESINWFQGERAKSEFSRSTSHDETFVSAGARVFVSTPSRTEQRLARTGGHGLAAKAVVKKGSTSEGKKPMNKNCFGDTEGKGGVRQGFAAFDDEEDNAESTRGIPARPALATKGHSIEDAIEL